MNMKKILIATAFLLSFAPACFAQEQTEAQRAVARKNPPIGLVIVLEEDSARITTDMEKTRYGGGEDFILHIKLKNVGTKAFFNKKLSYWEDVQEFYEIEVVDQVGHKVPRSVIVESPLASGPRGWGLKPGQMRGATVWLNNLFDFNHMGKYKVTVSRVFRRNGELITVSAEPVEFEIASGKRTASWSDILDGDGGPAR